jgi:hypothetical protein
VEPKLLRFMGKPNDLSPKARLKMLFGHPAPFDRHDWIGAAIPLIHRFVLLISLLLLLLLLLQWIVEEVRCAT